MNNYNMLNIMVNIYYTELFMYFLIGQVLFFWVLTEMLESQSYKGDFVVSCLLAKK